MSDNIDIDDFFKESFSDFKSTPNGDAWNGIENSLNESFTETVYSNKFDGYAVNPSSGVWSGISNRLWLDSFVHFSYNSFNMYYAASIIVAFFLAFNLYDFKTEKESKIAENNTEKVSFDTKTPNNTNASNKTTKSSIENTAIIVNDDTLKNTNQNNIVNNSTENQPTVNNEKSFKDSEYYVEPNLTSQNNTVNNNSTTDNNIANIKVVNHYIIDTVTIVKRDTLVLIDTVYKDVVKDPLAVVNSPWSADLYYSPFTSNSILNGPDNVVNNINDNTSPALNWTVGMNVNYKVKNFVFQTGLAYTQFSEKFKYYEESIEVHKYDQTKWDAVGEYTYIDRYEEWVITGVAPVAVIDTISSSYEISQYEYEGYIIIDTMWTYQTDTIIVNVYDSMYVVKYDTITALKYDSVKTVVIDTIKTRSFYEFVNRYSYMEIPLIVNYELKHNKFSYVFGGGIVTGIFINAKGKGISVSNEVVSLEDLPFMKLNVSGIINLGVHYHLNPKMSIILEGVYRHNFNSIYKSDYFLEQRFSSYGAKIGMRYRF